MAADIADKAAEKKAEKSAGKKIKWGLAGLAVLIFGWVIFSMMQPPRVAPAVTFRDLNGHEITLQQLRGKPVIINFWATSCPACIREMPHLADIYRTYQAKGVSVVAVAMAYDTPEFVKAFTKERQLPFPVVIDSDGSIARAFDDVKLTPTTIWVDRSGNWVETSLGAVSQARLAAWLDKQVGNKNQ